MGIVAHDLEKGHPGAGAVVIVGSSAQLSHVLLEQGDGSSRGVATSCSHLEELVHRKKDQLDGLEVAVHGAAHDEEGHQDALNYQDKHDRVQPGVQGRQKSHLVQDLQASHHKGLGLAGLHKKTEQKDQVVESHVDWDMGIVGHDPEGTLPIGGAAVVVGTI